MKICHKKIDGKMSQKLSALLEEINDNMISDNKPDKFIWMVYF